MSRNGNAKLVNLLLLSMLSMVLGACSLLPERTAKTTFMLTSSDVRASQEPVIPLTIRVLTPLAETPLNGSQILVSPKGQTMQAYGGARWGKPIPALVRDQWVEGLRQSGRFKAVVGENSEATSDLSLSSDLTRFQVQYSQGQPQVVIGINAQLLEGRSRQVIAAQSFTLEQSVADQPVENLVAGFGNASQAVTEQLVAWLEEISRDLSEEKGPARPLLDTESSTRR